MSTSCVDALRLCPLVLAVSTPAPMEVTLVVMTATIFQLETGTLCKFCCTGHRSQLRVLIKMTKLLRDLTTNPKRVITLDMTPILQSLGKPAGAKGPGTHYWSPRALAYQWVLDGLGKRQTLAALAMMPKHMVAL